MSIRANGVTIEDILLGPSTDRKYSSILIVCKDYYAPVDIASAVASLYKEFQEVERKNQPNSTKYAAQYFQGYHAIGKEREPKNFLELITKWYNKLIYEESFIETESESLKIALNPELRNKKSLFGLDVYELTGSTYETKKFYDFLENIEKKEQKKTSFNKVLDKIQDTYMVFKNRIAPFILNGVASGALFGVLTDGLYASMYLALNLSPVDLKIADYVVNGIAGLCAIFPMTFSRIAQNNQEADQIRLHNKGISKITYSLSFLVGLAFSKILTRMIIPYIGLVPSSDEEPPLNNFNLIPKLF